MIATQGHQDQSIRIHRNLSQNCQMLLFSATYDQAVMDFGENIVSNPVTIKLRREEESLDNIKQCYVNCETHEVKYQSIANIYGTITIGQAMIFCHTRRTAFWLAEKMRKDGHAVCLVSGKLPEDERILVLDRYQQGLEKILITTNVLSRGIDVEQVTIVVNFDLPVDKEGWADCETYLHRIGRTGRFRKHRLAINLLDGARSMAILKDIERHFGKDIIKLDAEDVDEIDSNGTEFIMDTCKGWKMDVQVKWYIHDFGFKHWSIEYGKFSIRRIVRLVRWYIRAGSKETTPWQVPHLGTPSFSNGSTATRKLNLVD
jgi:ATP-dependent RNA helicase DDX19/DBP5